MPVTYELRDYQHQWIKDIWNSWDKGNRRVLAQLPTAAGKTVCFAHISHKFFDQGKQVLVIAHRIELISQAAEKLSEIIGEPVGIIKAGVLANNYFRLKYKSQWLESLTYCSMLTGDFLNINAGLFHVETKDVYVNICIEVRELPGLKSKLTEICDAAEIEYAFTKGFGKQAKVMFRLS